jgi:3-hydroxybutyryl-CoA dehydrogenase
MDNGIKHLKKVSVIGAGTMGIGIAAASAMSGYAVTVKDVSEDLLTRARSELIKIVEKSVARGKVSQSMAKKAFDTFTFTIHMKDLADSDLIIEAAPERLELKQALFGEVDSIVRRSAILATNTSSLIVNALASVTDRPERFVGMHFFNPAHIMRLVEIIGGDDTSEETLSVSAEFATTLGKTTVFCQDTPGFIVNRVARPFYGEALRLLGENAADIETIDLLVKSMGFPMGPFELIDLVGCDVNLDVTTSVYEAYYQDPKYRPHPIQRKMVDSGRLGRKSGRGFYKYD